MTTRSKLALLASLYLCQGLPFGFFTQAVPTLLRQQGLSLPLIGATSLLALPWALKFLWAPYIDRYGSRKRWIVPLQLTAVVVFGGLAVFEPGSAMLALAVGMLVANLLAATQDIATDGLAVDLLSPRERGLGNGIQIAGYRVGMIVGGGFLLVIYGRYGWTATFGTMAAILALFTIPIAAHEEGERTAHEQPGSLWKALKRDGMGPWLILLATYKFGDAVGSGMLKPFLVDLQYSVEDIGWIVGAGGSIAGMVGAIVGGWATDASDASRAS